MKKLILIFLIVIFTIDIHSISYSDDYTSDIHYNETYNVYESNTRFDTKETAIIEQKKFVKKYFPYSYVLRHGNIEYSKDPKFSYTFDLENFKLLEDDSSYMSNWLSSNMRSISPDGGGIRDTLLLINNWICSNVIYNVDLPYSNLASIAVSRGYASCMGYTILYRDMVEYIPFNMDSVLVDWNTDDSIHLDIKMVRYGTHIIDLIYLDDTWYIIDITFNATGNNTTDYFMITWDRYKFTTYIPPEQYLD